MDENKPIQVIVNTFKILDYINQNSNNGINSITKETGLPKTSVHRIVQTLTQIHILIQRENGSFLLGHKLADYNVKNSFTDTLIQLANPFMKHCAEELKETLNLGSLFNNQFYMLHSVKGEDYVLQMRPRISCPLHCSGSGKLFLMEFSEEDLQTYFSQSLEKFTENTITDIPTLKKDFKNFDSYGLLFDNEEYEYGLQCIAAPIRDSNNRIIASLSISGPKDRLKHKGFQYLCEKLLSCAETINQKLIEHNL